MTYYPQPDDWLKGFIKQYIYVPDDDPPYRERFLCAICQEELEVVGTSIVEKCKNPACMAIRALQK